jgi:indole-3-glycerol phosphate synthase
MLQEILRNKREELVALRQRRLPVPPPLRPVSLQRDAGAPLRLIAEIKRRSPSAGALSTQLGVADRARAYEAAGAHMVSVLCDAKYFDGEYDHLGLARNATRLPILCKEFVLDESQLDAARAYGADAVLLIVRCMSTIRLATLVRAAEERGLLPLVEVHGPSEMQAALDAGARVVGVNARDLDTLALDADQARRVLQALPETICKVHLSGIQDAAQVAEVARSTVDAALIGESLMRADDPTDLLRSMVGAASSARARAPRGH